MFTFPYVIPSNISFISSGLLTSTDIGWDEDTESNCMIEKSTVKN